MSQFDDPRYLPEILASGNVPALAETAYLARETGIEGLRVWFNIERQKFVIQDTKAPGGPSASYVMIVQFDGERTPVDNRTVQTIRRLYGRHKDQADALIKAEFEREQRNKSRRESVAAAVADDLKWVGTNVVPTVAWDARSSKRDQIKREAGL